MRIVVNSELCRGCRICELACSFFNFGEFNPKRSRVRVAKLEEFGIDVPIVCRQCKKCICIVNCPEDALEKNEKTGAIIVNEEECTGCGVCVEACPFGAISLDPKNGLANVCNLCNGDPKCLRWCPSNVFTYTKSLDIMAQKKRIQYARTSSKPTLERWGILPER